MGNDSMPIEHGLGGGGQTMDADGKKCLEIIQHAIGCDQHGRYGLHGEYRNRYVIGPGCGQYDLVMRMVADGRMRRIDAPSSELLYGMSIFEVTDIGREYMRENSTSPPKLTRSQQRYLDWLGGDGPRRFGEFMEQLGKRR